MMRLFFIVFIMFGPVLCQAKAASGPFDRLAAVPPFPALLATAQTDHLLWQQFDSPEPNVNRNGSGDSVTALVTFSQKGVRTQWLFYLQCVEPRPDELNANPPAPTVQFSSCGNRFEFASAPAYVSLRCLGPFAGPGYVGIPPALQDKSVRFAVNQGILGIGLDRAAATLYRMVQAGWQGGFQFRDTPFSKAETMASLNLARAVHLTSEEERALSGMIPTLTACSAIARQTTSLDKVIPEIANLPSVWSVVWNAGLQAGMDVQSDHIAPADPAAWSLPPHTPVFYFPMLVALNKEIPFNITLVVTAPRPPLLLCGGVVGLLAEKAGDSDTYLTFRIVSARVSKLKTAGPPSQ